MDEQSRREALEAVLRQHEGHVIEAHREAWITEGVRRAYHSILQAAVDPAFEGDKERWQENYQTYKGALEHLRQTWPELDQK